MSLGGNEPRKARLLYFVDPMCSWCWGFAPVAAELAKRLPMELIAGGLRVTETRPMTAEIRETVQGHWHKVKEYSGQPFQFEGSLPDGFVYNSEPACRALVVGRELEPTKTLAWLQRLQQAFYAEGIDITKASELTLLADELGIDGFADAFESAEMREATGDDFDRRYESAVTGFPTLMLQRDGRLKLVCQGYAPLAEVEARLTSLGVTI